jgi:hypothetical protein
MGWIGRPAGAEVADVEPTGLDVAGLDVAESAGASSSGCAEHAGANPSRTHRQRVRNRGSRFFAEMTPTFR